MNEAQWTFHEELKRRGIHRNIDLFFGRKKQISTANKKEMDMENPGDGIRNQIDYIPISKRLCSAEIYPGTNCGSDFVPMVVYFKLKLKTTTKVRQKTHQT